MKRTWWAAVVVLVPVLIVCYVFKLVVGSVAAGATYAARGIAALAWPFRYSLKRAQGFDRISGAWVKRGQANRRKAVRS